MPETKRYSAYMIRPGDDIAVQTTDTGASLPYNVGQMPGARWETVLNVSSSTKSTKLQTAHHVFTIDADRVVMTQPSRVLPRVGDEVTREEDGRTVRGVVSDDHVKRAGQYRGMIEVVWIGSRYAPSAADPYSLTIISR